MSRTVSHAVHRASARSGARVAMRILGFSALILLAGCDKKDDVAPASSALASSASPVGSAEAIPPAPKVAWYVGSWSAAFEVVPNKLDFEQGGAIGWKKDDGSAQVGKASLALKIAEDGAATGKLTGALGERAVQGVFEADQLSLNFESEPVAPTQILTGTITAVLDGKNMKASLKASSGDSQIVRKANFLLKLGEASSDPGNGARAAAAPQAPAAPGPSASQ